MPTQHFCCFFFQEEDGIRDRNVTGVQTCALPILAQRVAASQAMLEMLAWRLDQGESPVAEICMLKNQATQTMAFCASEAVQIFGGAGYMRGIKVERIYREVKVNAIGGV